jgi:hypothetical protein
MDTLKIEKKSKNIYFALAFLIVIIVIVIILTSFFSIYSNYPAITKGKVIINGKTISVEVAKTPEELALGLSGREKLKENQGMLFVFKERRYRDFWMDGMKIPLDIIWIDDGTIIDITKNAAVPIDSSNIPIFHSKREVNYVLEVNAGYTDKNNINISDLVEISFK